MPRKDQYLVAICQARTEIWPLRLQILGCVLFPRLHPHNTFPQLPRTHTPCHNHPPSSSYTHTPSSRTPLCRTILPHLHTHNALTQLRLTHPFAELSSLFFIHTTHPHTPTTMTNNNTTRSSYTHLFTTCPIAVRHLSHAFIRLTCLLANLLTGYLQRLDPIRSRLQVNVIVVLHRYRTVIDSHRIHNTFHKQTLQTRQPTRLSSVRIRYSSHTWPQSNFLLT